MFLTCQSSSVSNFFSPDQRVNTVDTEQHMWPPPPPSPVYGPHSPASAATTTATSVSPPSAAMPRVPFSLRSPPSSARTANQHTVAEAIPVFTGDVWVPAEPSYFSFGFGAKWAKATLTMWLARVVDDAAARPMLHLRLGDRAAVVATSVHRPLDECGASTDQPQDKKSIHMDVKAVEDVRRAMLYHTAAARSALAFYVDTDAARSHLVHLIHDVLADVATASPTRPQFAGIRPPSPPRAASPPAADSAFAQLDSARAMHQRGHVVDALAAYAAADHALAASAPSARTVQARREIRAAVDALEVERALPRAAVAVTGTTVDVSEPATIDARLVELQAFAHARDVDRAQRERRAAADDLSLRLHALRRDKPTAPSLETLQQRLERLRGGAASPATQAAPRNPVDEIVQQAMDEVALGIADDVVRADDEVHDGLSTSSSDHSSSSDDEEHMPRRGRFGRRP